jgi:hypothetical protein
MADNNNIQIYQNHNLKRNNQNNANNAIIRLMNRKIQFNFDPNNFQSSIINSINNLLRQSNPNANQILQIVVIEIQNMSKNLIDVFTEIRGTINALKEARIKAYEDDSMYKINNDKNIQNILI